MRKLIIVICLFLSVNLAFCKEASFFDLVNIAGSFLSEDEKAENDDISNLYLNAQNKYNQANTTPSYDDFSKILDRTKNDFGLMRLAKSFYELGFFSLADKSLNSIKHKEELKNQIQDLRNSYETEYLLKKEDEIYLAGAMASIYFENLETETAYNLIKKEDLIHASDYANYVLSCAQYKMRQYKSAHQSIDKAIKKNPKNNTYLLFKAKLYNAQNNPRECIKFIKQTEKKKLIGLNFKNDFEIQKNIAYSSLSKSTGDKAYYLAVNKYLEGDIYSAKKILEDAYETNRQNVNLLSLLGFCNLKINKIDDAKNNFETAYNINKNSSDIIEGLGDIEFVNFKYQNALNFYEKALSKNPKNKTNTLNKALVASVFAKDENKIQKYMKKTSKINDNAFFEFYDISSGILKYVPKDKIDMSLDYLRKSIVINPLFEPSLIEFAKIETEKGNLALAKNIIDSVSMQKDLDYNFYYIKAMLCSKGGFKKCAEENIENAVNLNPYFVPSKDLKYEIDNML